MSKGFDDSTRHFCVPIILAALTLLAPTVDAQDLRWGRPISGPGFEDGGHVAVDDAGNTYVLARFELGVTLGDGEANETTLSAPGGTDALLAKYGTSGELIWARQTQSVSKTLVWDIATSNDVIYIAGTFLGAVTFGAGEPSETTLIPGGDLGFYVAAFDSDGDFLGATQYHLSIGSSATLVEFGQQLHLDTDAFGNVYVGGLLNLKEGDGKRLVLGPGEPNEVVVDVDGTDFQPYLLKFDSSGHLLWGRVDAATAIAYDIAVTPSGDVFMTGNLHEGPFTNGNTVFGAGDANETALSTGDSNDVFLARYDTNGELAWVRVARVAGHFRDFASGLGVAVDASGNSYVTGTYYPSIVFGLGEANETTLVSAGGAVVLSGSATHGDAFLAKFDPDGNLVWARSDGGDGADLGTDIA